MLHLRFSCPSELESILPPPLPSRVQHPVWYDNMPQRAYSDVSEEEIDTLKLDKGFTYSFDEGVMLRLACSIHVDKPGELRWDWGPPASTIRDMARSPVHILDSSALAGSPFYRSDRVVLVFTSLWTVDLPEGWSLLLSHPLNRFDTPFQVLSSIIKREVGVPQRLIEVYSIWRDDHFTGVLPRGMPFAQGFLIPDGVMNFQTGAFDYEKSREINRYLRVTTRSPLVMRPIQRSQHNDNSGGK